MKTKHILILLFTMVPLMNYGQYFRDDFLGLYNGIFDRSTWTTPGYALITESTTNTNNIIIYIHDTTGIINFIDEYILNSDSTFVHIFVPNLRYGYLYDQDSVYIYFNHLSSITDIFHGKKTSTGINEIISNDFLTYPNPAKNKIYIELNSPSAKLETKLLAVTGQLILVKSFKNISNSISIDLPELSDGIYFLNLRNEKYNVSKKVFIQK